jgi:TrmH family RNA methyltransferase
MSAPQPPPEQPEQPAPPEPPWPPAEPASVQRLVDLARRPAKGAKRALVEEPEPIANAIAAGVEVDQVYVEEGQAVPPDLVAACAWAGVPIRALTTRDAVRAFKSDKRARICASVRLPAPAKLGDILARPGDVVVLDGVRIVGNIGAIIRSAFALGAAGLVLVDSDLDSVADRRLLRASRGYVFALPTVIAEAETALAALGAAGAEVAVLEADGAVPLAELARRPGRLALVFGSERRGSSAALAAAADITAAIPMRAAAESLNVSVAVGIVLHARAGG